MQKEVSRPPTTAVVAIIMGVSGAGKTSVGRKVATRLGWEFYEGDEYHSASNVEKMSRGIALNDADRKGWLEALQDLIRRCLDDGRSAVLTCSALKQSYRNTLLAGNDGAVVIYLKASPEVIRKRIRSRTGHFFDPSLLKSQYETLEEPENVETIDAERPLEEVVDAVVRVLQDGWDD